MCKHTKHTVPWVLYVAALEAKIGFFRVNLVKPFCTSDSSGKVVFTGWKLTRGLPQNFGKDPKYSIQVDKHRGVFLLSYHLKHFLITTWNLLNVIENES